MSLDHTAIKEIQKAEAIKQANVAISDLLIDGTLHVLALPEDMKIHSIEPMLQGRTRYRGTMVTSGIADFAEYSKPFITTETQGFIDVKKMEAEVFFNLGSEENPGHGDFTAKLVMEKTAEFNSLLSINAQPLNQKALAEWIEDWNPSLIFADSDGNAIDPKKAAAAVRRITIESLRKVEHEDQDFKASRSAIESVEAKSEFGIPTAMRMVCIPYKGLNEYSFECRISIMTGGSEPILKVRIKQLENDLEKISEDFKRLMEDKFFDTEASFVIGKFTK